MSTTSPETTTGERWAQAAATRAATQALLACAAREGGPVRLVAAADADAAVAGVLEPGDTHAIRLSLPGGWADLVAGVRHRSPTGHHRLSGAAWLAVDGAPPLAVGTPALVGLVLDALADDDPGSGEVPSVIAGRILSSLEETAGFLDARLEDLPRLVGMERLSFIETEQSLLLGHPLHPCPKSRDEMRPDERARFAPERRARFALRWLAVDPAALEHDSATGLPAPELAAELAPPGLRRAAESSGRALMPAHPWQIERLRHEPPLAALLGAGVVEDLGEHGPNVTPTSSVRTLYREDWAWQLKFSLDVRITNSLRVTSPRELRRAVEAARLWRTPVGDRAREVAPRMRVLHDPAFLAIRGPAGIVDGLSVLFRENRWRSGDRTDVSSIAALCQDDPLGGASRLGRIVHGLREREALPLVAAAREWFARYVDVVLVSILRLHLDLGLCFEPHQQNVLLEMESGWPSMCVVRDSQGFFHREAAHADMCDLMPGVGEESESIFPERLADERLVYYPFLNNALGVVSALGAAGCASEEMLLSDLRSVLERERRRGSRYPATLLERLLDDATWPCKANLRTRLHDMDELVGDIARQSVYVRIPNPLRAHRP